MPNKHPSSLQYNAFLYSNSIRYSVSLPNSFHTDRYKVIFPQIVCIVLPSGQTMYAHMSQAPYTQRRHTTQHTGCPTRFHSRAYY